MSGFSLTYLQNGNKMIEYYYDYQLKCKHCNRNYISHSMNSTLCSKCKSETEIQKMHQQLTDIKKLGTTAE